MPISVERIPLTDRQVIAWLTGSSDGYVRTTLPTGF